MTCIKYALHDLLYLFKNWVVEIPSVTHPYWEWFQSCTYTNDKVVKPFIYQRQSDEELYFFIKQLSNENNEVNFLNDFTQFPFGKYWATV